MGTADVRHWEDRYRSLFEQSPIGVFVFDRSLRITECNEAFARIIGTERGRLVGLDMSSLHDRAPYGAFEEALRGATARYRGPYTATTSGRTSFVSLNVFPLRAGGDGEGAVVGGVGFVEDITEQERAATRLRASEARLAHHAQNTPLGVISWGISGDVTEWNESATRIFGYTAEEAMGKRFTDLIIHPTRFEHSEVVRAQILAGHPVTTANPNITKDGRTLWCEWYCTPIVENGQVVGVATLVLDTTSQKATLEALGRSEARFRELIERAPDAVGVVRDGTLIYLNDAFARSLGRSEKTSLIGSPLGSLALDDDREALTHAMSDAPHSASAPVEFRFRTNRGVTHLELGTMAVEYDGEPAVMLIGRDLTERKRMQAQLMQADRMVAMGTLAAGVAHEINNPLAYLLANLDLLALKRLPDLRLRIEDGTESRASTSVADAIQRCADMLDVAREGAERVRDIVRDLRTFSRDDDRKTAVDVRRVLDACVNIAQGELKGRAELVREYGDVPFALANESRLGQVFLNLIVNAAQALGGHARDVPGRIVLATHTSSDGCVVVGVSDNGPGITDADLAHIFDPFFTTKPAGVGTGLGLWICHGIVTGLGGSLDVTSEPQRGSHFRVTIPAYGGSNPPPDSPRIQPTSGSKGGRVLVIDDELKMGHAVRDALADDYDVRVCSDGREALQLLRVTAESTVVPFDVVLCDLVMPQLSGVELYSTVARETPSIARRFLFMTGGAVSLEARELLSRPGIRHLDKPFQVDALREAVAETLRLSKPA